MADRGIGGLVPRELSGRVLCLVLLSLLAMGGPVGLAAPEGAAAAPAPPLPDFHAHRGGPLLTVAGEQKPRYPEEGLSAYRAAARRGFVLELDVKLSADGVPIAIHDATLDRTTDCVGEVQAFTAAELRAQCRIDLLGTDGNGLDLAAGDDRREPIPTMAEVLALAERTGVRVNLEIKNIPGDPDFQPQADSPYARGVAAAIQASGFPPSRLIVQSFWPPNLDVIERDPYFSDTATSYLTLEPMNRSAPLVADGAGYEIVSPQWPVDRDFVEQAHELGVEVAPYTLDSAADITAAGEVGVDALITNDPVLARRTLTRPGPCATLRIGTRFDDRLQGARSGDRLRGGAGEDLLQGAAGIDCLAGGVDGDRLKGDGGRDRLRGGGGNDRLVGGPGRDRLIGGPGHDRIICGPGRDTVVAARGDRVSRDCERLRPAKRR